MTETIRILLFILEEKWIEKLWHYSLYKLLQTIIFNVQFASLRKTTHRCRSWENVLAHNDLEASSFYFLKPLFMPV